MKQICIHQFFLVTAILNSTFLISENRAYAAQLCSNLLEHFAKNNQVQLIPNYPESILSNIDSTEGAKAAVVNAFKGDPLLSLEKNWKRSRKWIDGTKIYRKLTSITGVEVVVVFDATDRSVAENLQKKVASKKTMIPSVKKLPQGHFLFAIDHAGMSANEDGYISVVIITKKLFEEEKWVPDFMEAEDQRLLAPILKHLNMEERMSNEFQMMSEMSEAELKVKFAELGLEYDQELQRVVDEMAAM